MEVGNFTFELNARMILTNVAIYRGNINEARTILEPAEASEEARDERRAARLRLTQGWLAAVEGDLDASLRILRPLVSAAANGTHAWAWSPPWMRRFAGIALAANDRALAETAASVAELGAARNPGVRTMEGLALQVRGIIDNDVDGLANAAAILREAPRPLLYAQSVADHAAAITSAGHRRAGEHRLREAIGLFDRLGAVTGALSGTASRNPAFGRSKRAAAARRRPSHGLDALTATERRVAELITSGHSSRSAAAALFVSTNTVNTHLRSIFSKLDVQSRVQLANVFRDRPIGTHTSPSTSRRRGG